MQKVAIMGILNITPDSFSDGGMYYNNVTKAIVRVKQMLKEGADIIDIGGESTRPGAQGVVAEEEVARILPVIHAIRQELGNQICLSVDTNKAVVARTALQHGATMINSLGGMKFDTKMADVVKEYNCTFVMYHIKGVPKTMQQGEITYQDVVKEIIQFFEEQIAFGISKGIKKEQFIIDPGIGFGKNLEQNLEIIKRLGEFKKLHLPILVGVSRKSHLATLLQSRLNLPNLPSLQERLEASLAETAVAVLHGATIVRTHDLLETKKFLTVLGALQ